MPDLLRPEASPLPAQPPVQTVSPAPSQAHNSPISSGLQKILVFILLLLIYINGSISGYYLGIKSTEAEHKSLQESLSFYLTKKPVTPKVSTSSPSTSDWKVYENTTYHFQVAYPTELTTNSTGEIYPAEPGHDKDLIIRILPILDSFSSYEAWLADQLTNGSFQQVIQNKPLTSPLSGNMLEYMGVENHTFKHAFIRTTDNKVIDIGTVDTGAGFALFDTILSTFRFTN